MIKVLYTDDEGGMLEVGKEFLEMSGALRVETALSAGEALKKLTGTRFDAIVSDYQMPVMDGLQFLRTIRANDVHIPFILFTGRGREEVVIDAFNSGANFYLQKGGDPTSQFVELEQKVRQAVEKRKAEEEVLLGRLKANLVMGLARIASWEYDEETKMFRFDDTFYSLYGTDALHEGGHTISPGAYISRFIHPEDRGRVIEHIQKGRDGVGPGGFAQIEHRILRRDGEVRWLVVRVGALHGADGQMIKIYGVSQDITERKRAEEGLGASART